MEEVIEKVFLKDVAHRLIKHLSKGYRQRVGIAQTLVSKPQILILDEPTSGLDPKQVTEIRNLLLSLKKEVTIVLSTHILSEVQMICDSVVIIHKGKVRAKGSLSELSHKISHSVKVSLKVQKNSHEFTQILKGFKDIKDVVQKENRYELYISGGEDTLAFLSQKAIEAKAGLIELRPEPMSLEDMFLELTQSKSQESAVEK